MPVQVQGVQLPFECQFALNLPVGHKMLGTITSVMQSSTVNQQGEASQFIAMILMVAADPDEQETETVEFLMLGLSQRAEIDVHELDFVGVNTMPNRRTGMAEPYTLFVVRDPPADRVYAKGEGECNKPTILS